MPAVPTLNLASSPSHVLTMSDGADIAVWASPEDDSPAVVFVHGFPENRLCWAPVLERLQAQTSAFRWVAYDLRGFGRSSVAGEACWQQMVADHLEVVRQLGLGRLPAGSCGSHRLQDHKCGSVYVVPL
jgi:pimeloyl-ACP methyl ester carboxylesterase